LFPYSQSTLIGADPSPYTYFTVNTSYMKAFYDALGINVGLTDPNYACSVIQKNPSEPKSSTAALEQDILNAWSAISNPSPNQEFLSSRKLLQSGIQSEPSLLSSCAPTPGNNACQLKIPSSGTFNLTIQSPGFQTSSATLSVSATSFTTNVVMPVPPAIPSSQTLFLV